LVDNAFRYSWPGSSITVVVETEEISAVIRVANEGSAIPVEEQTRIFERFYRGTSGNGASGTGLGLYIARKIVLAHGGALELDDRLDTPQTTFLLKLPLVRDVRQNELTSSQTRDRR
jgi:signal transduction histidine kinase